MFNQATLYMGKFPEAMQKDFKEKFPGVADELVVTFTNDPAGGEKAWADCVFAEGKNGVDRVFSAYLGKLYGNCGIATLSSFDVGYGYYKKGIGTWWLNWCAKLFTDMGYTIVIGSSNQHQTHIEPMLKKAGWEEIESCGFVNRRSKNAIKFWRLTLPEYDPQAVQFHMAHQGQLV